MDSPEWRVIKQFESCWVLEMRALIYRRGTEVTDGTECISTGNSGSQDIKNLCDLCFLLTSVVKKADLSQESKTISYSTKQA